MRLQALIAEGNPAAAGLYQQLLSQQQTYYQQARQPGCAQNTARLSITTRSPPPAPLHPAPSPKSFP